MLLLRYCCWQIVGGVVIDDGGTAEVADVTSNENTSWPLVIGAGAVMDNIEQPSSAVKNCAEPAEKEWNGENRPDGLSIEGLLAVNVLP